MGVTQSGASPIQQERDDTVLLRLVADDDLAALEELYHRHSAWLHARLMRRCNDPEVVADVLQDTFVALWKDARTFRGDGEVAGWLWGIAFRRMVSRLRSRKDVVLMPEWDAPDAGPHSPCPPPRTRCCSASSTATSPARCDASRRSSARSCRRSSSTA